MSIPRSLIVVLAVACTWCGCAPTGGAIHLPALMIEPGDTDPAFATNIRTTAARDPNQPIVCIVRFSHSLSDGEQRRLAERAMILKGSRRDTWFIRTSVSTVEALLEDHRATWIGKYEDAYKLGRRADTIGAERRWMHIVSFAGNQPEFRAAMNAVGIDDIRYDSVIDEYHVYIDGSQRDQLLPLWWVREIHKAGGRGLGRLMCR